jgi:hypothetical protein
MSTTTMRWHESSTGETRDSNTGIATLSIDFIS